MLVTQACIGCLLLATTAHAKTVSVDTFEALSHAVRDETVDEVVVSGALHVASQLNVSRTLSITAASHGVAASLVRPSGFPGVMLLVDSKGDLRMSNVSVLGAARAQGSYSAVVVRGIARFVNCTFKSHHVSHGQGGAIKNSGELTLTACVFLNNTAHDYGAAFGAELADGGAIYSTGKLTLEACVLTDNVAEVNGGALWHGGESALVQDCAFIHNAAVQLGSAIWSLGALTLLSTNFVNNYANNGAAVDYSGDIHAENCTFDLNFGFFSAALHAPGSGALVAKGCNFTSGTAILLLTQLGGAIMAYSNVTCDDCRFEHNRASAEGGAIAHGDGWLTLRNCQFANNSAGHAGGAVSSYVLSGGKGSITNCTFEDNAADGVVDEIYTKLGGGAISANEGADLSIRSCNFTGGAAYAGAAVSLTPADGYPCVVSLEDCNFVNGSATNGGAAWVSTSSSVLTVVDCHFDHNLGTLGGTLYIVGFLNMSNSTIVNSRSRVSIEATYLCYTGGCMAGVARCTLQVTQVTNVLCVVCCYAQCHLQLGALAVSDSGEAKVFNSIFKSNSAQSGGAMACNNGGKLHVEESLFEGNSATSEDGGAILLKFCSFAATRCNFTRNFSGGNSGAIHVGSWSRDGVDTETTPPTLTSCNFIGNAAQFSGGAVESAHRLLITASTFVSNQAADGGAICNTALEHYAQGTTIAGVRYIADSMLNVTQCTFRNNSCTQDGRSCTGGAIQNDLGNTTIIGSTFINNSASFGGGLFIGSIEVQSIGCHRWPTHTVVKDSTFTSNSAGQGGAVAVDASLCERAANVSFYNATLASNIASNGGALYITCFNATLPGNNNASDNGGAAAGFCNAVPDIFCSDGRRLNMNTSAGCPDWVGNRAVDGYGDVLASAPVALRATVTSFLSHTSQQPLSNVSVYLVDQFDQSIYSTQYDGTVISAEVLNGSCNLLGDLTTALYGGSARLTNLNVNGTPGLKVLELSANRAQLPVQGVPLLVGIRTCAQGEVASADGSCTLCSAPTFSWDTSMPCTLCPEHATCFGGAVVVPEDGFWRSSFYSADIIQCPNAKACTYTNRTSRLEALGAGNDSVSAVDYRAQLCAEGYTGNLCAVCVQGYGMTRLVGKTQCRKCPSTAAKAVYMLVWIVVEVALVAALIALTVVPMMTSASTGQLLNGPSRLKLAIHFLQSVALAFVIQQEWPAPIDYMTEALATVFLAQSQLLPLDCFMSAGSSSKAYTTTIIYAVLPVAAILPPVLFWSTLHWWSERRQHKVTRVNSMAPSYSSTFWQRIVPSILCVEFFLWPTTIANLFALFSCRYVDPGALPPNDPFYNPDQVLGLHWQQDMSVKCFQGAHLTYALAIGIPGLLLSMVLLPGHVCWVLSSNRHKLDQPQTMRCWGFYYMMYKPSAYLWDGVMYALKLVLVVNSVVLVNAGGQAQNAIAFGIVNVATALHWHRRPYARQITERLSGLAHAAACYLVFMGMLLFLQPSRGATIAIDVFFALGLGISLAFSALAVARFSIIKEMWMRSAGGGGGGGSTP
eukprot:jgi/Chlat1/5273/Chrsp336S04997